MKKWLRRIALAIAAFYAVITLSLFLLRWINPLITAVQIERRIEGYHVTRTHVPISEISNSLQHAVVAAEDARFYQHHGFDWNQLQTAIEDDLDHGKRRGASTITQQLVKNLFLTTRGSFLRKGLEFTIVPMAELLLPKKRILELYLNEIEWGPGIYGVEAAARHYYKISAKRLNREQSVDLASVLPNPLHRRPGRLPDYARIIDERMRQMAW